MKSSARTRRSLRADVDHLAPRGDDARIAFWLNAYNETLRAELAAHPRRGSLLARPPRSLRRLLAPTIHGWRRRPRSSTRAAAGGAHELFGIYIRMSGKSRNVLDRPSLERAIRRLARNQRGLVAREQLLALGWQPTAIDSWLRIGRLHPVHHGVYLLGTEVMPEGGREMAAVLACGRTTTLVSHLSAAYLLQLLALGAPPRPVHVISTRDRRRPGIVLHRVRELHPSERRSIGGIPLTGAARTLVDIANLVPREELELAVAKARGRGLTTAAQLGETLVRHRGRPGVQALRAVVADEDPVITRSPPERWLLAAIRAAGLPEPAVNVRIGPYEVDFVWRSRMLVVELDGYSFHASGTDFERDRRRDAYLEARGFHVVQVSRAQRVADVAAVTGLLRGILGRRELAA